MEQWISGKRVPLKKGSRITLEENNLTIVIDDDEVFEGSSCLVYHGHIEKGSGGVVSNRMIVKEFYPDPMKADAVLDIRRDRDSQKLVISDMTKEKAEFKNVYRQFGQGLELQKYLASSEAMEIAAKPLFEGHFGDGYYIISDIHNGRDLGTEPPVKLGDKLVAAVCLAETMDILHSSGMVMTDIKPENYLWQKNPDMIRIIDTDSLIRYREDDGEEIEKFQKNLLMINRRYTSPEVQMFEQYIAEGISEYEFREKKELFLRPVSDLYAIGTYLYELFWNEPLEEMDLAGKDSEKLLRRFTGLYSADPDVPGNKIAEIGRGLIQILGKLIVSDLLERTMTGYGSAGELMRELNDLYFYAVSDRYVPRVEIARASASLAAYNMLQQYPLFEYAGSRALSGGKQIRCLETVVIGAHEMREEMVSAIISIGQMLDSELTVRLISEDAGRFWSHYCSEECNPALGKAVTWSLNGKIMNHITDKRLVDRPLAHVSIITEDIEKSVVESIEAGCRYFVLMEEKSADNRKWLDILTEREGKEKTFIAFLQDQEEISCEAPKDAYDLSPVSTACYSEYYSEKMFRDRVFHMGMMTHAYYCGYMDENASYDVKELEQEFRRDIYNIKSSERCALHSIYKLASLNIERNRPGRILNFYKRLSDPGSETLEALAWLEHLSWSAYLLTSGAVPVSMDDFGNYAYKNGNDWKNSSDSRHMGHPLLVSSEVRPKRRLTAEEFRMQDSGWPDAGVGDGLDELDRVSVRIYQWFVSHRQEYRQRIEELFGRWNPAEPEEKKIRDELLRTAVSCVEGIGRKAMDQDRTMVNRWKRFWREAAPFLKKGVGQDFEEEEESASLYEEISESMRPVIDSYKDRDYKQLDRNLVYAAADMIV